MDYRRLWVRAGCATFLAWLAAADSLSMKKAIEKAMQMMDSPNRGGN